MKPEIENRRQVLYWRLLSAMFNYQENSRNIERMAIDISDELQMPRLILDGRVSVDDFLHRHPELEPEFQLNVNENSEDEGTLRKALIISKLLLNTFGEHTQGSRVTATQYAQWLKDVEHLERCMGYPAGALRGNAPSIASVGQKGSSGDGAGEMDGNPLRPGMDAEGSVGNTGTGRGFIITDEDLRDAIQGLEKELVDRMELREILQDEHLAAQLTPSDALVTELLRDKSNLSGVALKNAKRIIRNYVDELAAVLKMEVDKAPSSKIDYSVPPKRVYRNLDLKRTIWRNLTNWNPQENRLYVDKLFYKHTSRKRVPSRLMVVVDQSGSMINAMAPAAIMASIFSGLPNVNVDLIAYDTRVIDLTAWVHDPFEVLMRTNLGGGNDTCLALDLVRSKMTEPRRTVLVLISDFYEGAKDQQLYRELQALIQSGVKFLPIGAVTSGGYFSVNPFFRTKLKEMGTPILTGSPKKLIRDLKKVIVR
jgi:hypothetical protein